MNGPPAAWRVELDERPFYPQQPLYARVLRLRQLSPGPMLCFVLLEGSLTLGLLLALAELAVWWIILALPMAVAVTVKANDMIAAVVLRSAALVPEQEQERFRREVLLPLDRG
ncbi:MAG TPA: hypothetical protein VF174_01610 [Micromonosporaceae bacterium]